jgi:hypothetical protein
MLEEFVTIPHITKAICRVLHYDLGRGSSKTQFSRYVLKERSLSPNLRTFQFALENVTFEINVTRLAIK